MNDDEIMKKLGLTNQTFTPGAAISLRDLFAGRVALIREAVFAMTRPGQHAVLFGERGVGKTSLANIVRVFVPNPEMSYSVKVNASTEENFSDMWKGIFREIDLETIRRGLEAGNDELSGLIKALVDKERNTNITPNDVRFVLSQLPSGSVVIIDEFDRIRDRRVIAEMTDTIKALSDFSVPSTIIIVGIADSVADLVEGHESITRAVSQIHVPRMSDDELRQIVENGAARIGLQIPENITKYIVRFSQGFPHFTHLLALEVATSAISAGRLNVTDDDLKCAIETVVERRAESTAQAYYKATQAHTGKLYPLVLLACAITKGDERGFFRPADVGRTLERIRGDEEWGLARFISHLGQFASPERGGVLVKVGRKNRFRYRFADPTMRPFVILKGISSGLIKQEFLLDNDTNA